MIRPWAINCPLLTGIPPKKPLQLIISLILTGGLRFSLPEVNQTKPIMLKWTIIFLVIALIAAVFGFGGIAAGAADIAEILFYIFIVLFVISLIMRLARR